MKVMTAAFIALLALAGCNTVKGVGKDVQAGGEAIEEGAEKVQEEIKQ